MKKTRITPTLAVAALAGLMVSLVVIANSDLSARTWSHYRPGDCVRTPIIDTERERWQRPNPAKDIYMIADVGEQHYKLRGWGFGSGSSGTFTPKRAHWYTAEETDYQTVRFKVIDDTAGFQQIPCPEEQPEEIQVAENTLENAVTFTVDGGTSVGTVFEVDQESGLVTFRNSVFRD